VHFEAELTIDVDNEQLQLTGDDGTLVVTGERLGPTLRLLRSALAPSDLGLRRSSTLLSELGATVRLDSHAGPILTVGNGARPKLLTRLIGAPHVRIESLRRLFTALVRAS
jgi:hypothetical protein